MKVTESLTIDEHLRRVYPADWQTRALSGSVCMTFGDCGAMVMGDGSVITTGDFGIIPPGQATQCDYCGRINDLSKHENSCPGCGAPITGKKMWGG